MLPRMAPPPKHQRPPKDFKPGRVVGWPAHIHAEDAKATAQRVSYCPDGKHKDYPAPNGEWTLGANSEGTKCLMVKPEQWGTVRETLRAAVEAGVIDVLRKGGFPSRTWAFINGKLHEARISNDESGWYHAFPLDYEVNWPKDPDGRLAHAPRIEL